MTSNIEMNNLGKRVESVSSQLFCIFMFSPFFPCMYFVCFLNLKKSKVLIYLEITSLISFLIFIVSIIVFCFGLLFLLNEEFIFIIVNVYFKCNRFSFFQ